MPYTGMPAWPRFTEEEVSNLVCFVKAFNADFADTSIHAKTVVIPKAPAYSQESADKGKALYKENKCMDCHGALGRGDGESGPTLKDDWSNPIPPADLTRRWTFRGGHRREDIYRTFTTGLNGTPMPSFASSITEADRWRLVDYVYSLSSGDEPPYASMVTADSVPGKLDLAKGQELFKLAKPALFPVVGQVIEGERDFFPTANAVEVRAVYDAANVAIMVSWHDMNAQKTGANTPLDPVVAALKDSAPAPVTGSVPAIVSKDSAAAPPPTQGNFSDAVSIQIPYKQGEGNAKPYFLFGDKKNPAEIWFADMAQTGARTYIGKGRGKLDTAANAVQVKAAYSDGEWSVIFLRARKPAKGLALEGGGFMPIAFSVWDGFTGETGSKRGVTSWYTLYLNPPATGKPYLPAAGKALAVLAFQAVIVFWARRRTRKA